ncbi:hypothetical protein [Lacrimispora sp.]|uniref:hypothetical protein n=1 Tax=Lacrimispora sp. TaxID=2719234 RepID=UPI00289A9541|nr:hypothetical protein [Lacrimispora sp.]
MKFELFDQYDIQARLSPGIILISPFLFSLYMQIDVIRTLSTTTVVFIILFALSNFVIVFIRLMGKRIHSKRNEVAAFLYSDKLDESTKKRYYKKLASIDDTFHILIEESQYNTQEFKDTCISAVNWLKEQSRGSVIVNKENTYYGFFRNMYGIKYIGITTQIFLLIIHVIQLLFFIKTQITIEYMISVMMNSCYLILWIFGISKNMLKFCLENYAEALILFLDKYEEK